VAAAGNLAAASRSHHYAVRAGLDGTRASLAVAEVGSRSKKQRMIAPLAKFIDWCDLHGAHTNAPFHFAGTAVFNLSGTIYRQS
jgi:hypothetical protein